MNKKSIKKNAKSKYRAPKSEEPRCYYPTKNSEIIAMVMKSQKIKGKFKDYVVISGNRLIDWLGSYDIVIKEDDEIKKIGVNGMAVIHKSKLKHVIGEMADTFWKCGVRTNFGVERRRYGCKTKAK